VKVERSSAADQPGKAHWSYASSSSNRIKVAGVTTKISEEADVEILGTMLDSAVGIGTGALKRLGAVLTESSAALTGNEMVVTAMHSESSKAHSCLAKRRREIGILYSPTLSS
jgi:hypothetical protein